MIIDVSKNQLDIGLVINDFKKKIVCEELKESRPKLKEKEA